MPILIKAAAPVKGTATLFTLDKAALAAVTSVAADAYFSDSANWKSVSLLYHSSIGNQHEVVKFEASQSSPTSKFLVSEQSRDIFEIKEIVIKDFDGGTFKVLRSELTTAEFDVDLSVTPSSAFYSRDFSSPSTFQSFESSISSSIIGGKLVFDPLVGGAEYTANPSGVEFTQGVQYQYRIYVSANSQVPLSLSFQLGEIPPEAHSFSEAQISAARGAFLEYSFTATANQVTTNPFIRLIKNGGNATLSVDKIEILEL